MQSSPASDQCAVAHDGTLFDVSEITFYNDPDDDVPLNPVPPSARIPVSSPSSSLHPFFAGSPAPAKFVAGSRKSGRVTRPSNRLIDPDNGEAPPRGTVAVKRAASGSIISPSARRKLIDSGNDSEDSHNEQSAGTEEESGGEDGGMKDDGRDTEEEMEDLEQRHALTKAMGDADREALGSRRKEDRTADVRTIFTREKRINPDTQEEEYGSWCTVCRAAGVTAKHCFFKGSVTSLRNHIARNPDHVKLYIERCQKLGLLFNDRVLAKTESAVSLDGMKQGSLNGIVTREPRMPAFTSAGMLDYVIELIVSEDKAFQLIDKGSFRRLLKYLRPALSDKEIPHRTKLRQEILRRAQDIEVRICERLGGIPGRISFTFDTWTSDAGDPYLSVTGHYIWASEDQPMDWSLKTDQLAFTHLEGNHSGSNIGNILVRTFDRYNLRSKLGWATADNAPNNFTGIRAAATIVNTTPGLLQKWDPAQRYIRCMEHAVDLSARHFVATISPSVNGNQLKKIKKALQAVDIEDEDLDLDLLNEQLAGIDGADDGADDDDDIDNVSDEFEAADPLLDFADSLGKALALVKQIRASPQARAFFKKSCVQNNVPTLQLLLWIRTRWASMYSFLDRMLTVRKAINHFVQLADDSDEVPTLRRKSYTDFRLGKQDWRKLELMHEVLKEPASAKQTFSSSREPTVFRTIPVLEFLQESWENMADLPRFYEVEDALRKGLANLEKWYRKVSDVDAYFICLVLNPNIKTAYTEDKWKPEFHKAGMKRLGEVFDGYYIPPPPTPNPTSTVPDTLAPRVPNKAEGQYGYSWMQNAVRARVQAERVMSSPRDELKHYLESPLEKVDDVIQYWGRNSGPSHYPTLARMARDYLAIQGSATPSERAFSGGSLTGVALRNRLDVQVFEALQLLKSAYQNGHIDANSEVQKHFDAVWKDDNVDVEMTSLENESSWYLN
ncbi:hypothetical protein D9615_006171 [Tricholomella constricta]|uniref:HAT C-terminal dimerisation domain-containing protein n=1 Tax=Tricholomella constricta TaxID=117010 RepID=A0A8H5HB78_9AGAR|nr:hypothetical protein D9615_006171 [Tricholomella constricta]